MTTVRSTSLHPCPPLGWVPPHRPKHIHPWLQAPTLQLVHGPPPSFNCLCRIRARVSSGVRGWRPRLGMEGGVAPLCWCLVVEKEGDPGGGGPLVVAAARPRWRAKGGSSKVAGEKTSWGRWKETWVRASASLSPSFGAEDASAVWARLVGGGAMEGEGQATGKIRLWCGAVPLVVGRPTGASLLLKRGTSADLVNLK